LGSLLGKVGSGSGEVDCKWMFIHGERELEFHICFSIFGVAFSVFFALLAGSGFLDFLKVRIG
jgi:hypothetical protein